MRRAGMQSPLDRNVRGVGAPSGKLDPGPMGLCDSTAGRPLCEPGAPAGNPARLHRAPAANPANTASSCPSDLAASGDDGAALTAQGGGEGEPHSQSPDTLLGNTDKELNTGVAVTLSTAGTAPVAPCQREPRDLAMEPGLWGACLGKG